MFLSSEEGVSFHGGGPPSGRALSERLSSHVAPHRSTEGRGLAPGTWGGLGMLWRPLNSQPLAGDQPRAFLAWWVAVNTQIL